MPLVLLAMTRLEEACDVDLNDRVLYVRRSKFYKTRLVPIGADLTQVLREYARGRCKRSPLDPDAPEHAPATLPPASPG